MQGLGLPESFGLKRSILAASSGEQAKLLLGMALFAKPSVLILDDPSVHLDTKSKAWLAQYLKASGRAVLISAYDSGFIESVATAVVGLTEDRGFFFSGDFSEFTEKVERVLLSEHNAASALAKSIESLGETVQKMYANSKVSRSKDAARVRTVLKRRLGRMEVDYQNLPGAERKRAKARSFEIKERGGDNVVTIQGPTIRYGENIGVALPELSLTVIRGERLAVVGPNGSGKTTLAKSIAQAMQEEKQPDEGRIIPGANISTGYFSPDRAIQIKDRDADLLSAARVSTSGIAENQARSILAYWGFSHQEMMKRTVASLGRAERTLMSLALIMLRKPNLLVLDEPTTGLDQEMTDKLIESLREYPGTIIVISHDPLFLDSLDITQRLKLPGGEIEIVS
jgi:ATP-binding cassette subfamily F protein 3